MVDEIENSIILAREQNDFECILFRTDLNYH